jgi:hypothetical protein
MDRLPIDCWERVTRFLNVCDAVQFSSVNRRFRDYVNANASVLEHCTDEILDIYEIIKRKQYNVNAILYRRQAHTPDVIRRYQNNISWVNQLQWINQHILQRYSPHPINLNSSDQYWTYEEIFNNVSYSSHHQAFGNYRLGIIHIEYAEYLASTLINDHDILRKIQTSVVNAHLEADDREWFTKVILM